MALSGPRLPPKSGKASHLVVLCHGYGADGNDLIGLAPMWQRALPTVAFAAPNAPEPCAGSPTGYQWFPISRLDPHEMARGVESAVAHATPTGPCFGPSIVLMCAAFTPSPANPSPIENVTRRARSARP